MGRLRGVSGRIGLAAGAAASMATVLAMTPAWAHADGPCGQDYTTSTACAINTAVSGTYQGTIDASNETDFYAFYAQSSTNLSVGITDTEDALCSDSSTDFFCGAATVELFDAASDDEGGTGWSMPENDAAVPATWSTIIPAAGTYYLEVTASPGLDENGNPTPVPYSLAVGASPNVQWPVPAPARIPIPTAVPPPAAAPTPPPCVVPGYKNAKLATVKGRLVTGHCAVGTVSRVFNGHVRRGRVVETSSPTGTSLPEDSPINIVLSRGGKPHRNRHHAARARSAKSAKRVLWTSPRA